MRIIINGEGFSIEDKCWGKECDHCPFRFKCYSARDEIRVAVDELDKLALRNISGRKLLELSGKYKSGSSTMMQFLRSLLVIGYLV